MLYYINHTSNFPFNTGVQRCVRSIARGLIGLGISLKPVVWDTNRKDFVAASRKHLQHMALWSGPNEEDWEEYSLQTRSAMDEWILIPEIVSGPYQPSSSNLFNAATKLGIRVAWIFHDAIPIRHARLYGLRRNKVNQYHSNYMKGLSIFDLVLANSQTTCEHLQEFLNNANLRYSHVLPLRLPIELPGFTRHQPVKIKRLDNALNFLTVGSLEPRKNHVSLLKAIAYLNSTKTINANFYILGWPNTNYIVSMIDRCIALGLPIKYISNADDELLNELYETCEFTIYPSLEEGFGLPVAESIWHRRPCLCGSNGALGEFSKYGGIFNCDTKNWLELAKSIDLVLSNKALRIKLHKDLLNNVVTTWNDYCKKIIEHMTHT